MTDIKELALKVAKEMPTWGAGSVIPENYITDFATRLIAAYCEWQEQDESQNWKGMSGAVAWHLIDRHGEDWSDIGNKMDSWLKANTAPPELAFPTCKPPLQVEKFSSDAAEKAPVTPEDLLPAAGGSPAVFCPDTPLRKLFEDWVKRRAPIAEFTRNKNGEYIVLGMHGEYLAFCAGASIDFPGAAPSSEEVRDAVARLNDRFYDLDEGDCRRISDLIERLAARVPSITHDEWYAEIPREIRSKRPR